MIERRASVLFALIFVFNFRDAQLYYWLNLISCNSFQCSVRLKSAHIEHEQTHAHTQSTGNSRYWKCFKVHAAHYMHMRKYRVLLKSNWCRLFIIIHGMYGYIVGWYSKRDAVRIQHNQNEQRPRSNSMARKTFRNVFESEYKIMWYDTSASQTK